MKSKEEILEVEPTGSHDSGICDCCGGASRCVWGFVHTASGRTLLAYYVHWTLRKVSEHGANFDLVLGEWGDGTGPEDRSFASFQYSLNGSEYSVVPIDARSRFGESDFGIARGFIDHDDADKNSHLKTYLKFIDSILLGDNRVADILPGASIKKCRWWWF